MEEALRTRMRDITALHALVNGRINWGTRPQGDALPDVVLHLIDDIPQTNLAGPGVWSSARVQVDCWGRTHNAARLVANTIAAPVGAGGLHCLRETIANIRFRIFVIDRSSDREEDAKGIIHRTRLDLNVWWAPLSEA